MVYGPASAPSTEQELTALRQQAEYIQDTLQEINERIKELEKAKQKK
jgi:prefoldin subunit 5